MDLMKKIKLSFHIDVKKCLWESSNALIIRVLERTRVKELSLNIIKATYDKLRVNTILDEENFQEI